MLAYISILLKTIFRKKHFCITSEISGELYDKVIDFLMTQCDQFAFCVPNLGKTLINESNAKYFPEYKIGYTEMDDDWVEDYNRYRVNIKKYLDSISEHIKNHYIDTIYCDSISEYEKEIFLIELNDDTRKFFDYVKDLYQWKYPDFPEDLSFYRKGKVFMSSVAHENMCEFCKKRKVEEFLKNNNIEYYKG